MVIWSLCKKRFLCFNLVDKCSPDIHLDISLFSSFFFCRCPNDCSDCPGFWDFHGWLILLWVDYLYCSFSEWYSRIFTFPFITEYSGIINNFSYCQLQRSVLLVLFVHYLHKVLCWCLYLYDISFPLSIIPLSNVSLKHIPGSTATTRHGITRKRNTIIIIIIKNKAYTKSV